MKVLKFGGSSVASADRIREVGRIILGAAKKERIIVVVSALQGITSQLLECARRAEAVDPSYRKLYSTIVKRHIDVFKALHGSRKGVRSLAHLEQLHAELNDILRGIRLLQHCPPRVLDLVGSFGERCSALLLSSYLSRSHASRPVDARQFIITDDEFTHAAVLFDHTNPAIQKHFLRRTRKDIPVVTGFIGSTRDGRTTTIGRNGSDYTAAIIGAAVKASSIEIWTDVDGIMSADPRIVPSAFVVPQMSYEEGMELSYFGATVLHSATIAPAVTRGIPVHIKNTLNPTASGTMITRHLANPEGVARGISSIDDTTLLTLRGLSMVGIPGTAERLFNALASVRVNVILISQASSEHTICFAVRKEDSARARESIKNEFRFEFAGGITTIDELPNQSIVAIVGDGMKGTPGVAGQVFGALGRNNVNISAIAQGASERNISFVIGSSQKVRALNVIHQAFFEKKKRLDLIVVGVGTIGSTLLQQLLKQRTDLAKQGFDVRVVGVADSKRFLLEPDGIRLYNWRDQLDRSSYPMHPAMLAHAVGQQQFTNVALVDCTASAAIVNAYELFVRANAHIITPNKKANVLPLKSYTRLVDLMKERQKYFLYEANVGAGLPVISTLRDLVASGDTIVRIEGILSGTLSYLFNQYDGQQSFSTLVKEARELGFTEPDPREDLSGQDVARKILILARLLGLRMNLGDIRAENLVPPGLRRGAYRDEFFKQYRRFDSVMEKRFHQATNRGAVLRYVGVLEKGRASARLLKIPTTHPFASTKGSDNILAFTTERYSRTPLVIQGPGAGADVTAMGVFSDILKLLHYLPY